MEREIFWVGGSGHLQISREIVSQKRRRLVLCKIYTPVTQFYVSILLIDLAPKGQIKKTIKGQVTIYQKKLC